MEKCINCQFVFTGYCNGTCILKKEENLDQSAYIDNEEKMKVLND